ncbi:MAG: hypothetical protein H0W62_03180 [Chitinophagales bacterium]|nr:hypothetical protein [Chitinophagales bacterium]
MKVFKEMVTLVTKQRLGKVDLIDEKITEDNNNLYHKLFQGIYDGTFSSDEEAARSIYQTSPGDKKYLMLKSRLKERLINSLFFLNYRKTTVSPYQQAVYTCNRNYFSAKILLTHGARTSAISMAKSTLTQSIKFDLNELVFLNAKMLRHHSGMMGLKKDFQRFDLIMKKAQNVLKAEGRAEFMYESLLIQFARSKTFKPEFAAKAREYYNQSKEFAKHYHTFHVQLIHYRIGLQYYQIIRDYRKTLTLCNRFEIFQKKHPNFHLDSREGEIALLKMVCCLFLREYKNGLQYAEDALKYYSQGSNNWFIVMENYFLLALHGMEFKQATSIYGAVTAHPRYQYLSAEKLEKWKIFQAYLNYVSPDAKIEFKILKFLNEVPIYSKDKAGFYPAILIAQILYLMNRKDDDRLDKNMESLRIFSSRYLSVKTAPRTTLFIKRLRQIINQFQKVELNRQKFHSYLQNLKISDFGPQGETDTMEIIPYENILHIITANLQPVKTPQ